MGVPTQVNIHEAKTHLSRLLARVATGEEIVIARAGTPVARLVPWSSAAAPRIPGRLKGSITIHDDFDDPLPDSLSEAFRGDRP
jgi:prevent-host-death family protein